ncbi:hypothetical protein HYU93_04795 [Candidatus Daviesbacteria bacterium]|nr:hypothetical protein [Candidatus Daviesbacteria bacterium]
MAINNTERRMNGGRHPSIEDASGVRLLHPQGLVAAVFSGEAFLRNWYYLFEKGAEFVQRDLGRSETAARALMEETMSLDNLLRGVDTREALRDQRVIDTIIGHQEKLARVPSMILVRYEEDPPGDYIATTLQRTFFPKIDYPDPEHPIVIPSMYHGFRGVREKERCYKSPEEEKETGKRLRIGRLLTDLALLTHKGVKKYVHRAFHAVAVWANMNAENLIQTSCRPYKKTYDKDEEAYLIVKAVRRLLKAHGSEIELNGISRGVTEPNRRLEIRDHPQVIRLDKLINDPPPKGLGLVAENGDLIYGSWDVQ